MVARRQEDEQGQPCPTRGEMEGTPPRIPLPPEVAESEEREKRHEREQPALPDPEVLHQGHDGGRDVEGDHDAAYARATSTRTS